MAEGSRIPPMTTKQAKAAYRKRGGDHISDLQKRQYVRGGELQERAAAIKAKEERKKANLKKREALKMRAIERGLPERVDPPGYVASQLCLDQFWKQPTRNATKSLPDQEDENMEEEYDTDDLVDDGKRSLISEFNSVH